MQVNIDPSYKRTVTVVRFGQEKKGEDYAIFIVFL
jgi:hypothetical protein